MIEILYEDAHVIVCVKPVQILSQDAGKESMPELLRQQFPGREIFPVHRLDKAVGGVMVYACSQKAAAALSKAVQERTLDKAYFAVLCACPSETEGQLEDLLFHDKMKNKTYVVDRMRKGVKDAKLQYRVLCTEEERTLVHVRLFTGRTHQIRVQFASRKMPLVGDGRYGGSRSGSTPALWSCALRFDHPITKKQMIFFKRPTGGIWEKFQEKYLQLQAQW